MAPPSSFLRWRASRRLGLAGRAERDPIEPVSQQVGVADRAGLAGQDEEDGLEGVLGMVPVAQELAADAQDHGPVPRHQRGEGGFAGGIAPRGEPLEELAVGQPGDGAAVEERLDLPDDRTRCQMRHARGLSMRPWFTLIPSLNSAPTTVILSQDAVEKPSDGSGHCRTDAASPQIRSRIPPAKAE